MAITYLGTRNDAKHSTRRLLFFFCFLLFGFFVGNMMILVSALSEVFLGRTAWKMRVQQKGLSQSKRSEGLFCGKKN